MLTRFRNSHAAKKFYRRAIQHDALLCHKDKCHGYTCWIFRMQKNLQHLIFAIVLYLRENINIFPPQKFLKLWYMHTSHTVTANEGMEGVHTMIETSFLLPSLSLLLLDIGNLPKPQVTFHLTVAVIQCAFPQSIPCNKTQDTMVRLRTNAHRVYMYTTNIGGAIQFHRQAGMKMA